MISDITQAGPARPITIGNIETHCAAFDAASDALESMVRDLESDLAAAKAKHLQGIKRQAAVVARRQADLHSLIERAPELFKKPRTFTLCGVQVGFRVVDGALVFDCDDKTMVQRLKDKFGEKTAKKFIITTEKPDKDAIRDLEIGLRAELGASIKDAGDAVVLKRVDGDIEKLINKLIERFVEVLTETK